MSWSNTKAQDHWQITSHSSETLHPGQRLCPWKQIHKKALTHLMEYHAGTLVNPVPTHIECSANVQYSKKKEKLRNTLGAGVRCWWFDTGVNMYQSTIYYDKITSWQYHSVWLYLPNLCKHTHTQTVESGCSGAAVPGSLKGVWSRGCVTGVPGGLNPGHLLKWLLIPLMQTTCPTCCALFKTRPWTL